MVTISDYSVISAHLGLGDVWILCGGMQLSCSAYSLLASCSCSSMFTKLQRVNHRSLIFSCISVHRKWEILWKTCRFQIWGQFYQSPAVTACIWNMGSANWWPVQLQLGSPFSLSLSICHTETFFFLSNFFFFFFLWLQTVFNDQ